MELLGPRINLIECDPDCTNCQGTGVINQEEGVLCDCATLTDVTGGLTPDTDLYLWAAKEEVTPLRQSYPEPACSAEHHTSGLTA